MPRPHQQAIALAAVGVAAVVLSGCAVNHRAPLQSGAFLSTSIPTTQAQEFGQRLFEDLRADYALDSSSARHGQLTQVFNHLAASVNVDPDTWRLYLFEDPQFVNVRAVHGNFMFVWSGVFDVVESEDELAGLVACELAHALARHTRPVQFSLMSELFFGVVDLATTVGITVLSQGLVSVSTSGLTKWAYMEATDLDPLDRVYTDEQVQEMAAIALAALAEAKYSRDALVEFWKRVRDSDTLKTRVEPLIRRASPQQRVALLESVMLELPAWQERITEHKVKDRGDAPQSAVGHTLPESHAASF